MSAIDSYNYTCLGLIECPMPYRFFSTQESILPIHVAIYQLGQDIPEYESDFQGNKGDILVGGGGGEAPAMRIKMPEAILLFTNWERYEKEYDDILIDSLHTIYWSPTQVFMLCSGYETLGWNPEKEVIGQWLMEHVICFVVKNYSTNYQQYIGLDSFEHDGSICRLLSDTEDKIWNWLKYRDKS